MYFRPPTCFAAIAAVAPLALASLASAQTTIYSDPLIGTAAANGSGYQTLAGTQPATDVTNAYWNAQYYSAPSLTTAGLDNYRYNNNLSYTALLPLKLDGTGVYTLSVNAVMPVGGYNSIDFGFTESNQNTNNSLNGSATAAYIDLGGSGMLTASYAEQKGSATTPYTLGTTYLLSISLNSSSGTLTFSENGTAFATEPGVLSATQIAAVTDIALASYYAPATAYFTNVSLSEVIPSANVPEPGSWSILSGAVACMCFGLRHAVRKDKTLG